MTVKRKTYELRKKEIIEVEEYHDGNYGSPGMKRVKRKRPTEEQMKKVNHENKMKRCRHRLNEYFDTGDIFATWTYEKENRPKNLKEVKKDFQKAIRVVKNEFKKRGESIVYWIKNIEKGRDGAWHIHLVIREIGDTISIITKSWISGRTWFTKIRNSKFYDEDFTKLAYYMTKDEYTSEIKEASYSTSRNMPLPEPKIDKLKRWKEDPKPKKGYYIYRKYEGINPVTGFMYRRYTMIKLGEREKFSSKKKKDIRRRKRE